MSNTFRRFLSARTALLFAALLLAHTMLAALDPADPTRYLNDVKALTTPQMEGRGAGTKGLSHAANLLEKRYKSLGLKPAGTHSYLQPFSLITGARLKSDNRFTVRTAESGKDLKINQDYVPFSFSSSGSVSGPAVFAGYGASADEFQYDDYHGLDVKDKIVVVLRYEPAGFAAKTDNHGLTQHSQLITKAINARNHGAKALILVNGKTAQGEDDLPTRFGSVTDPEDTGIVFVQVKNDAAQAWFQAAGK